MRGPDLGKLALMRERFHGLDLRLQSATCKIGEAVRMTIRFVCVKH